MAARFLLAAASVAVLGLTAAPGADAQPGKAAARTDWTRTVVATAEGGFRMGNPQAKVKLVEYASLTCPHCADFAKSAKPALAARVSTGRMSFEYRPYVLNGIDAAATLLARCAAPANFFRFTDSLFATQAQWVGKVSGMSEAQKNQMRGLPEGARLVRIAEVGGLIPIAAQAGITAARAKACLADPAGLERIGQIGQAAVDLGVQGTPTFFINGRMVHAHDWAELEPVIRQAGG